MKVKFLKNVKGKGVIGQIKEVSDGYAQNYLIPKGIACSVSNAHAVTTKKHVHNKPQKQQKVINKLKNIKKELTVKPIQITSKVNDSGTLFAQVTVKDIVKAIKDRGFSIEKKWVTIKNPIKTTGNHEFFVECLNFSMTLFVQVISEK